MPAQGYSAAAPVGPAVAAASAAMPGDRKRCTPPEAASRRFSSVSLAEARMLRMRGCASEGAAGADETCLQPQACREEPLRAS